MADFTKQAIKQTFLELLREKSLSEITVREVTETCGINRNTFYYHFRDIPAVVEEIMTEQTNELIVKHPTLSSVEDCLYAVLDLVRDNREVILHIYNSLSRPVFEKYLFESCYLLVENYWNNTAFERTKEEIADRRIILDCSACLCFGLTMRWLSNGMDDRQAREDAPKLCRMMMRREMLREEPEVKNSGRKELEV